MDDASLQIASKQLVPNSEGSKCVTDELVTEIKEYTDETMVKKHKLALEM